MEDVVFNFIVIDCAPFVSDSHNVARGGVVVEVVNHAAVAVLVDFIVSPVFLGAHVDVMVINGSDSPQVSGNQVVAQDSLVVGGRTVNGDAATAVHRVVFVIII